MGDLTKNFSRAEFACKCGCGFNDIDLKLVEALQRIRDELGRPVTVTSGCRCEKHNLAVGGSTFSTHRIGKAADIACEKGPDRFTIFRVAMANGIKRFGMYDTFVHLDVSESHPSPNIWIK